MGLDIHCVNATSSSSAVRPRRGPSKAGSAATAAKSSPPCLWSAGNNQASPRRRPLLCRLLSRAASWRSARSWGSCVASAAWLRCRLRRPRFPAAVLSLGALARGFESRFACRFDAVCAHLVDRAAQPRRRVQSCGFTLDFKTKRRRSRASLDASRLSTHEPHVGTVLVPHSHPLADTRLSQYRSRASLRRRLDFSRCAPVTPLQPTGQQRPRARAPPPRQKQGRTATPKARRGAAHHQFTTMDATDLRQRRGGRLRQGCRSAARASTTGRTSASSAAAIRQERDRQRASRRRRSRPSAAAAGQEGANIGRSGAFVDVSSPRRATPSPCRNRRRRAHRHSPRRLATMARTTTRKRASSKGPFGRHERNLRRRRQGAARGVAHAARAAPRAGARGARAGPVGSDALRDCRRDAYVRTEAETAPPPVPALSTRDSISGEEPWRRVACTGLRTPVRLSCSRSASAWKGPVGLPRRARHVETLRRLAVERRERIGGPGASSPSAAALNAAGERASRLKSFMLVD